MNVYSEKKLRYESLNQEYVIVAFDKLKARNEIYVEQLQTVVHGAKIKHTRKT